MKPQQHRLAAGADVNQVTGYGWSPLLVATQNRYYKLGAFLLDHGADVNLASKGAWTPLYLATDNRNIESGPEPNLKRPQLRSPSESQTLDLRSFSWHRSSSI